MQKSTGGTGRSFPDLSADQIGALAAQDSTVLVYGHYEAAIRLFAGVLHDLSQRNEHHFMAFDCRSNELVIECADSLLPVRRDITEVFMAVEDGQAEWLAGGTILLTNTSDLNASEFEMLNGQFTEKLRCRVIVNMYRPRSRAGENLRVESSSVVGVELPTLRQNEGFIRFFANYFLAKANIQWTRKVTGISDDAMKYILQFLWAGDIEELRDVIYQAVMISEDGSELPFRALPRHIREFCDDAMLLRKAIIAAEHRLIQKALQESRNNKKKAAAILKISRKTLYSKLRLFEEFAA